MKLKNEALQKLYDKLGFDTLVFGISRQSQIDKAFIEFDEELSDSVTFAQIKDLQDRCDIFEKSNGILLGANLDLATKKASLEKDLDNAKKNVEYFRHSRDDWKSRAKHAEDEVEGLKKKLDFQQNDIVRLRKDRDRKDEAIAKLAEMRDELQQKADDLKNELQAIRKDHGRLHEENRKSNARTDCLSEEVKWYRKHYKEQSDKIRELKKKLAVPDPKADTKEEHTITLTMGEANYKIILKLLSSKAFGASPEHMREYMRDSLKEFCDDHCFCQGCPLRFSDCNFDDMSDEEIEKCYKITILSNSKRAWHGDATAD